MCLYLPSGLFSSSCPNEVLFSYPPYAVCVVPYFEQFNNIFAQKTVIKFVIVEFSQAFPCFNFLLGLELFYGLRLF
jgi:hypothetical protein